MNLIITLFAVAFMKALRIMCTNSIVTGSKALSRLQTLQPTRLRSLSEFASDTTSPRYILDREG